MKYLTVILLAITLSACSVTDTQTADTATISVQGAESFNLKYPTDSGVEALEVDQSSITLPIAPTGTITVNSPDAKITVVIFGEGHEIKRQWSQTALRVNY